MAKAPIRIPEIRLTEEQRQSLKDLDEPLSTIRRQIEALKRAGFDVSLAEDKLKEAETMRKTLLEHF